MSVGSDSHKGKSLVTAIKNVDCADGLPAIKLSLSTTSYATPNCLLTVP